jgi:hypothetical protein
MSVGVLVGNGCIGLGFGDTAYSVRLLWNIRLDHGITT